MVALRNRFKGSLDVPVWSVMIALLLMGLGAAEAKNGQPNHTIKKVRQAVPVRVPLKVLPSRPTFDVGLNRILEDRAPVKRAKELGYKTTGDRIQLVLVTEDGKSAEVLAWLKDNGATNGMLAGNLVEAFVPVGLLETIAAETRILYVRKPLYFIPESEPQPNLRSKVGVYTSEGVPAMNADAWHIAGYTGQGVTVAVIDEGFMGTSALIGTELPQGRVFGEDFSGLGLEGGSEHGTACAEIVYDVAPGISELHLYRAPTPVEVVNAVNAATARNIDVISMSLGWLVAGPGDGTGVIANSVNSFVSAGGTIAVSAGNSRISHWQGSWFDPDGNGYLNFFSESEVNFLTTDGESPYEVPADTIVSVQLKWNQWSTPTTDLDLQLHRWNPDLEQWDLVDSSELPQNGTPGQTPFEVVAFTTTEAGYYGFTVTHFSGPTSVDIELIARPDMPLSVFVQDGSVLVPGDTGSAMSVAALDSAPPYSLEIYSSRGPTNGAGGSLTGGYVKPDISGYANVSTASYGYGVFNGTSAACPHVAGAAALVWGANTNWTNSQVRSYLESHSEDKGVAGKDIDYGYGRLYLGSPGTAPPPGGGGPCNQDLDGGVVCLRDGRFEFIGTWTDFANPANTQPLIWTPVENINATAGFQNNPSGIQIVMRVADGCSQTGTYWVWLGGFTGAGWDITVRDTVTGESRNFNKPRQGSVLPTTTRDSTTFTCD